ncbi:unnamed protein product [Durusdinium trenchii]|uniref:Uncharacterized protein n=1 Tax=Durusdinium trenchii TaxID=1381693 RepID=A0ABP0Q3P3_9DINO
MVFADLPQAVVVSGAGCEEANGVYKATEREYCDAPVYEHAERGQELKITREPHKNAKTGAVKHGWLLGQSARPLYGAPTESLTVPASGWKKFGGEEPVPTIKTLLHADEIFFISADDSKLAGDDALEQKDWKGAIQHYTAGIDILKRTNDRLNEGFRSRACLLLTQRGTAHLQLKESKAALRDAVAAMDLEHSAAEALAVDALTELGFKDVAQKILEPVGSGKILDPAAPLVLRCVDRWVSEIASHFSEADAATELPMPIHMPSDRYLDGLDEETRAAVIKRYIPEEPFGGTGVISNATDCFELMKKWEEVFSGPEFQSKRKALWDRRDLSFPLRLKETRTMVAECLANVLEPMGFAPGRPGLARCVKQMQVHWSTDKNCANKALDLEELADVSLADLE